MRGATSSRGTWRRARSSSRRRAGDSPIRGPPHDLHGPRAGHQRPAARRGPRAAARGEASCSGRAASIPARSATCCSRFPRFALLRAPEDHELVLAAQPRIGRLLTSLAVVDRPLVSTRSDSTRCSRHAPTGSLRQLLAGARVVSWFGSAGRSLHASPSSLVPDAVVALHGVAGANHVWEHLVASVAALASGGRRKRVREPIRALRRASRGRGRALPAAGWDGARPLVMLHPGAGGTTKRWAVEAIRPHGRDARRLVRGATSSFTKVPPIATRSPATRSAPRAGAAPRRPAARDAGRSDHHATLCIGNDSGVTHLAAAVGTPMLALFTPANLAWRPWARTRACAW